MIVELGQPVTLSTTTEVDGVATDATTVALTITTPAGTATTYTLAAAEVTRTGVGAYEMTYTPATAGTYYVRWVTTGTAAAAQDDTFTVDPASNLPVSLQDVKDELGETTNDNDARILRCLRSAVARLERDSRVGYITRRTVTDEIASGAGYNPVILSQYPVVEVTAASYYDGTAITVTDLDVDQATGMVRWANGTTGYFTTGSRNLRFTYTVGRAAVEPHIHDAIVQLAVHYYRQRHGSNSQSFDTGLAPDFNGLPNHVENLLATSGPVIA